MTKSAYDRARYEGVAIKLIALGFTRLRRRSGDIFRHRHDGLQVQLTRPIGTFDWRVREVGTMRRIELAPPIDMTIDSLAAGLRATCPDSEGKDLIDIARTTLFENAD